MFTEIRARNFKSWSDLKLPLGKVTGLFGANSSGKTSILQALLKQAAEVSEPLSEVYYLGPFREEPRREYAWTGARPTDVGYKGAAAIPALLASRVAGEPLVEERVANWLAQLGLADSFRVAPVAEGVDIFRVYVRRSGSSAEVLLADLGLGVSQVLPVLVLLAYVPDAATVIMEQPEIYLYPSVQAGLADVILEASRDRDLQVIVESHSEHLLRRIQLRVAEERLENGTPVSSDDVRLWFIDQEGTESRATDLKLNQFGEIMNWPQNFFGDPFGETARIAKASLRRRLHDDDLDLSPRGWARMCSTAGRGPLPWAHAVFRQLRAVRPGAGLHAAARAAAAGGPGPD